MMASRRAHKMSWMTSWRRGVWRIAKYEGDQLATRVPMQSLNLFICTQMLVEGLGWPTSKPKLTADSEHWQTLPVLRGSAQRSAEDELKYQTLTLQVVGYFISQATICGKFPPLLTAVSSTVSIRPDSSLPTRALQCPERCAAENSQWPSVAVTLCRWLLQLRPAPAICNPCMLTTASSA